MFFSISAFLSHSFMLSLFLSVFISLFVFLSHFLSFSLSHWRKRRNETTAKAWKIFIQLGTTNKKVEWVGGKKSKQDDIRDTTIASNEKEKNGRVRESACVRKGESKRERERERKWLGLPVQCMGSFLFSRSKSLATNHPTTTTIIITIIIFIKSIKWQNKIHVTFFFKKPALLDPNKNTTKTFCVNKIYNYFLFKGSINITDRFY